jgi:plastocyanin
MSAYLNPAKRPGVAGSEISGGERILIMSTTRRIKELVSLAIVAIAIASNFSACTIAGSDATVDPSGHTVNAGVPDKKSDASKPVDQPAANEVLIVIENFAFVPSEVTIAPGTKVTWINKDEAPHTATSTDKKFNSGGLDTDDRFSFVFNDAGEFPYFCALHPHMTATVTVK